MESRDPSAAPSSGGDTVDDQPEDVKPSIAELDPDESTASVVPAAGTPSSVRSRRGKGSTARKPARPRKGTIWISEGPGEGTEDEGAQTPSSRMKKSGSPDPDGRTQGTAVGTRRQANGTVGSVYSGSKVRHIKKPDGTPLWRGEIQYEFLRLVIEDSQPVFTRISDKKSGCNFADIYVDCMARSSKTSKVLRDRLQIDRKAAQNMGMICLLVNVGRMNTTLNFFPEMRAQLRTYHSIPSLQAYESQRDYKSLQDAPRLKSILKGASEDTDEPRTLTAVKAAAVPRTNPVNLIFVLSQFAPEVAQLHFTDRVDFFDLAIRSTISSKSRARAFLWLMWWYLEAPVHDRQTALNNPFGPGEFKDTQDPNDPDEIPQLVPKLVTITEEEGEKENEDPEEEKAFAEKMTRERRRLMAEVASGEHEPGTREIEHKGVKRLKKNARDSDDDSDSTSMRASPSVRRSPAVEGMMGLMSGSVGGSLGQADSLEDDWEAVDPHPGRGRYKRVKGKNTPSRGGKARVSEGVGSSRKAGGRASGLGVDRGTPDTVGARGTPQPLPPGGVNHPVISQYSARRPETESTPATTKSRARTGYQRQLEEHRNSRIEWLLKKKRRDMLKEARERRSKNFWLRRVAMRLQDLDPIYDSDEDEEGSGLPPIFQGSSLSLPNGVGMGGLIARRAVVLSSAGENGEVDHLDRGIQTATQAFEDDDFGEEAESWLKVFKRAKQRLHTWTGDKDYDIYVARKTGKKIPVDSSSSRTKPRRPRGVDSAIDAGEVSINDTPFSTSITGIPPAPSASSRVKGGRGSGRGGGGGSTKRHGTGTGRGTGASRKSTSAVSARNNKGDMSLNDEITQDLLAERSDDDEDQNMEDVDNDHDNENDSEDDNDDEDVVMEDIGPAAAASSSYGNPNPSRTNRVSGGGGSGGDGRDGDVGIEDAANLLASVRNQAYR